MLVTTVEQGQVSAEASTRDERTRYWVLPKLQARFIGWLAGISALAATTVAWAILLVVWSPLSDQLVWASNGLEPDALFWSACFRVLATTGLLIIIFGLVAFVTGLLISHRVAGPLHRMGLIASQVASGHYSERVQLRRGDYVPEFAQKFNEMLDHVEQRFRHQRVALSRLQSKLSDLEAAATNGASAPEEIDKSVQEVLRAMRDMRRAEPAEEN